MKGEWLPVGPVSGMTSSTGKYIVKDEKRCVLSSHCRNGTPWDIVAPVTKLTFRLKRSEPKAGLREQPWNGSYKPTTKERRRESNQDRSQ
jgi:hypothetical protein